MKKIFLAAFVVSTLVISCESKKENTESSEISAPDSAAISAGDTSKSGIPTQDTTSTYEKQHYGNGNTETSGNSGH